MKNISYVKYTLKPQFHVYSNLYSIEFRTADQMRKYRVL